MGVICARTVSARANGIKAMAGFPSQIGAILAFPGRPV
ncbi:hypothetical protein CSIRO_1771 [Bradyrhizobiaceae bacterium SG-6C]|nr:hypothetical protein CSIRO_1771 [Bradyrhizobiaceae bacterium SG-6C]